MGTQDSKDGVLKCITGAVMMQMSAKAGIKEHGQVGIDAALFKEFAQPHDLGVFFPRMSPNSPKPRKGELCARSVS
jgi:hypothetical protein